MRSGVIYIIPGSSPVADAVAHPAAVRRAALLDGEDTAVIDTRNEYKAMPYPNDPLWWKLYYRKWWSPFWTFFACSRDIDDARERCIEHATPDPRKPFYFGRLP